MVQRAVQSARMAAALVRMTLLAGGIGMLPAAALAHAHLQGSTPAANASLTAPPKLVELSFTEPLEVRFSRVALQDQQGKLVVLPAARQVENDAKRLLVELPVLPAGTYTVIWRVVSIDTHSSEGRFIFSIRQP